MQAGPSPPGRSGRHPASAPIALVAEAARPRAADLAVQTVRRPPRRRKARSTRRGGRAAEKVGRTAGRRSTGRARSTARRPTRPRDAPRHDDRPRPLHEQVTWSAPDAASSQRPTGAIRRPNSSRATPAFGPRAKGHLAPPARGRGQLGVVGDVVIGAGGPCLALVNASASRSSVRTSGYFLQPCSGRGDARSARRGPRCRRSSSCR